MQKPFNINQNSRFTLWPLLVSVVFTPGVLTVVYLKAPYQMLLVERFFPGFGWIEIAGLTLYSIFLTFAMTITAKIARVRSLYWRIFSLIFFTQLILGLTVSPRFLMTGRLHLPVPALIVAGPLYRGRGIFMLVLLMSTIFIIGPGWCGHLCYIGAWDDVAAHKKTRALRDTPPPRYIRYIILGLTIAVPLLFRRAGVSSFFAAVVAASFGITGVGIMVVFSTKHGQMVHCTAYCPIGGLVVMLGRISPFRLHIRKSKCNECGRCGAACRYGALSGRDIAKAKAGWSCVLCGDCIPSCHGNAIQLTIPLRRNRDVWSLYASLVVSLHSIFIGLARI
jgi:polyferredoxin